MPRLWIFAVPSTRSELKSTGRRKIWSLFTARVAYPPVALAPPPTHLDNDGSREVQRQGRQSRKSRSQGPTLSLSILIRVHSYLAAHLLLLHQTSLFCHSSLHTYPIEHVRNCHVSRAGHHSDPPRNPDQDRKPRPLLGSSLNSCCLADSVLAAFQRLVRSPRFPLRKSVPSLTQWFPSSTTLHSLLSLVIGRPATSRAGACSESRKSTAPCNSKAPSGSYSPNAVCCTYCACRPRYTDKDASRSTASSTSAALARVLVFTLCNLIAATSVQALPLTSTETSHYQASNEIHNSQLGFTEQGDCYDVLGQGCHPNANEQMKSLHIGQDSFDPKTAVPELEYWSSSEDEERLKPTNKPFRSKRSFYTPTRRTETEADVTLNFTTCGGDEYDNNQALGSGFIPPTLADELIGTGIHVVLRLFDEVLALQNNNDLTVCNFYGLGKATALQGPNTGDTIEAYTVDDSSPSAECLVSYITAYVT